MKNLLITFSAFLTLLLWSLDPAHPLLGADSPARDNWTYDWSKTKNFIEAWSKRPTFPDSISFAYYFVYSKRALGLEISKDERNKLLNFIKDCQTKDGGFVSEPKFDKDSNIISSFYAIKALDMLKEPHLVNEKRLAGFLHSMFTKEGGMRLSSNTKEASLAGTALGVVLLNRLSDLTDREKRLATAYILKYKTRDDGFGLVGNKVSSIRATAMAVAALKSMNAIGDIKKDVICFLSQSRYSGLIKEKRFKTLPSMEEMAQFLATVRLVGSSDKKIADPQKISKFVRSLYIPENGGFGPEPGLGTTPPSTYYGLFCLVELGRLKPADMTGMSGFFSF
ncbi:prenyltransferase/squalene oxidase repeat-containing protein [Dissulfurimicrobium hydrothermale]|nr:terpene cyclase/mutase family protein [Dissulfurimicrobium hydrothermale]